MLAGPPWRRISLTSPRPEDALTAAPVREKKTKYFGKDMSKPHRNESPMAPCIQRRSTKSGHMWTPMCSVKYLGCLMCIDTGCGKYLMFHDDWCKISNPEFIMVATQSLHVAVCGIQKAWGNFRSPWWRYITAAPWRITASATIGPLTTVARDDGPHLTIDQDLKASAYWRKELQVEKEKKLPIMVSAHLWQLNPCPTSTSLKSEKRKHFCPWNVHLSNLGLLLWISTRSTT